MFVSSLSFINDAFNRQSKNQSYLKCDYIIITLSDEGNLLLFESRFLRW